MLYEVEIISHAFLELIPERVVLAVCPSYKSDFVNSSNGKHTMLNKTLSVASASLELNIDELKVEREPTGKPRITSHIDANIGISVTHTTDLFICGLNKSGELGIDAEKVDRKHHKGLIPRILHPNEKVENYQSVIHLWTLKEAVLKLIGTGLRTNMNKIHIQPKSDHIFQVNDVNYEITIVSFEHQNHWVSLAYT